jgi:hypothetical protein
MSEAYFNRFFIELPDQAVKDMSHAGPCDDDAEHWQTRVHRPPEATPEVLARELHEYGAWDDEELEDDAANWRRVIWLAAVQIKEEQASLTCPNCSRRATLCNCGHYK